MSQIRIADDGDIIINVPMSLRSVSGRKRIITPGPADHVGNSRLTESNAAVKAIARAYSWQKMLDDGTVSSATEIAERLDVNLSYVTRTLRLVNLSPKIIRRLLSDDIPDKISLGVLTSKVLASSWEEQEKQFRDVLR